ncbi:ATP-grasp domain-containing protein [Dactylosporangium salmoneum]|uniref:ATP-grasp domain-containing protein n=1 Tax=Dactylosporangium salmoneum TaxID=53361 RepID=A0ABN3FXW4_9ACTN
MTGVLFLDPGADVTRRDVYRRGRELGARVVLVAPRLGWERDEVDDWIPANPAEPAAVLAALADRPPPLGVVNCSETCLETAAAIAARYGLPGLPAEVVARCRDKVLMGERLAAAGVPMARRYVLRRAEEAAAAVAAVGRPGVLKPSTGVASRYTVRFDDAAELAERVRAFEAQLAGHRPAFLRHMDGRWLVESYLSGTGYSVESLVAGGVTTHLAVCEKGPITGPYFREIGHVSPPDLPTGLREELCELAGRAIQGLGIDNCVTHAEFKVPPEGPRLLEIGARMGGGSIRQVVRHATGVDLLDLTLRLALGERPAPAIAEHGAAASRSLYPPRPGRVPRVDVDRLARLPGVVAVNLWMREGAMYRLPPHGYGEVLGVVATAPTAAEAVRLADAATAEAARATVLDEEAMTA